MKNLKIDYQLLVMRIFLTRLRDAGKENKIFFGLHQLNGLQNQVVPQMQKVSLFP